MQSVPKGQDVIVNITTHDPVTGVVAAPDSLPTYAVYAGSSSIPTATGSFSVRSTGDYVASVSTASLTVGQTYTVTATAVYDSNNYKTIAKVIRLLEAEQTSGVQVVDIVRVDNVSVTSLNDFKATGFAVAGDAMALTSSERTTLSGVIDAATPTQLTAAQVAIIAAGDAAWATADVSALATTLQLNALESHGDSNWSTATGFATPSNVTAVITAGDLRWQTATGFATSGQAITITSDIATVDSNVDAIKAKTDQFVFTVANQVDANALTGGGGGGDATEASVLAIKTVTDQLRFTVANQVDANALTSVGGGGGSGDATEAKQDTIIGLLATSEVTASNPVISPTVLELTAGDTYDGTNRPLLSWDVAKDYTGASIELRIWRVGADATKTTMKTAAGVVASSVLLTVEMDATFDAALDPDGCPLFEKLQFALVAIRTGEEETIARGDCYVYDRD